MQENGYNPQDNSQDSSASKDAYFAKFENDLLGRVKLDELKASGHQYTKSELKKLGKGAVVDIVMSLQDLVSELVDELRKATLTIESLRAMKFD